MTGEPYFDPAALRVSDDDRDRVLVLLQRANAEGFLDVHELAERSDVVIQAKTRGQLNVVLADLPLRPESHPMPAVAVSAVERPETSVAPVELSFTLSSLKRTGDWLVPPYMLIRGRVGSASLDFTEATFRSPLTQIELDVKGGSVEVRVPPGSRVVSDSVRVTMGSFEVNRRVSEGDPNGMLFVFSGSVAAGSVEVRGPSWWQRRGH